MRPYLRFTLRIDGRAVDSEVVFLDDPVDHTEAVTLRHARLVDAARPDAKVLHEVYDSETGRTFRVGDDPQAMVDPHPLPDDPQLALGAILKAAMEAFTE